MNRFTELISKKSIARTLGLYTLGFSIFITLLSTLFQLYTEYSRGREDITANINEMHSSFNGLIIESLWITNDELLSTAIQGILTIPYVEKVEIQKPDGTILTKGQTLAKRVLIHEHSLEKVYKGKIVTLGYIKISFNLDLLLKKVTDRSLAVIATKTVWSIFLALTAVGIFYVIVGRHLIKMSDYSKNISIHSLDTPLTLNRRSSRRANLDEIDLLSTAINDMREKLKSSLASLRDREAQYRAVVDNTGDYIMRYDTAHRLIYANRIALEATGLAIGLHIGRTHQEMGFPPHLCDIWEKSIQAVFDTGKQKHIEFDVELPDGQMCLDLLLTPEFAPDGRIKSVIGISRDITARKKAERELNLTTRRYQALFQKSPIPLWEEDFTEVYQYLDSLRKKGIQNFDDYFNTHPSILKQCSQKIKILDVNQEALRLHGAATQKELMGNLEQIFTEKSFNLFKEEVVALSKGALEFESEGEVQTLAGEKKSIFLKMIINKERDDSIRAVLATIDITDRNQMEARLRQAQKMESIGNLAGGIAHDFNNLLFPIMGMSEMLLGDLPEDSPEHDNANEIFLAGKRASDLVKQILTFSRQSEYKMAPVRVQDLLKEVLKLCRSTIPSNIEIHENIQQNCGLIMADPTQIHQVVMNLITNAFHAVEDRNGAISIELKETAINGNEIPDSLLPPGPYIRFSVSDNGIGIPRKTIHKIFEPYFTTKKTGEGTGLGLSVVYGIVKKHQGEIKVYSEEGKGTTFTVYLPLLKKNAGSVAADHVPENASGTETILLVDDEVSIAKLEGRILSRLGYQVTVKTSSEDALNAFRSDPDMFDLVISDMTMPGMTGDRLSKEILALRPDVPIIICTGFSKKISKEQAESMGIKGFLMKPVLLSDLARMVRHVLDASTLSAVEPESRTLLDE